VSSLRIEPEEPVKENRCESCGGTTRLLHGYVYEDEYAHGIYFLEWCDGDHPRRAAFITIGLGAFGEGTDASDRSAFGVEWREDGMALTEKPPMDRPDLLGEFLPRELALTVPNIDKLWHALDHVVVDDPRAVAVGDWLLAKAEKPKR